MAKGSIKKSGSKGTGRAYSKRAASGKWVTDSKKVHSKKGDGTINPGPGKKK